MHKSGPKRSALHRCDPRHCPQATSEPWTRSEAAPSAAPRASPTSARWPRSACACVCGSCVRLLLPLALLQGMAGPSQCPSAPPREMIGPFQFPQHRLGGSWHLPGPVDLCYLGCTDLVGVKLRNEGALEPPSLDSKESPGQARPSPVPFAPATMSSRGRAA